MENIKKKILENVDALKDELVTAVSNMVQIKSVTPEFGWNPTESTGGESAVNEYTFELMKDIGIECELYEAQTGRANLCGIFKGEGGGRSLLFNGHVDVVPPGDLAEWGEEDPFSGKVDDEYIYGRGSVDMKGGNAAALFALKAINNAGVKLKGDVIYQNVVGEECKVNEAGTSACLEKGYVADAAIVCEPTCSDTDRFQIYTASVGVMEMKWKVRGKSCHVGMRREVIRDGGAGSEVGVDAIEKGMIIYNAIKNLERQWGQSKSHPQYKPGHFCINAATVKGGTGPSFVAPDMEMSYAITYPPQDSSSTVQKEISDCVYNACQNDPWLKENPPEITWIFDWPSFNTDMSQDICQCVQASTKEIVPDGGNFSGFIAVCDASFMGEYEIPVVVMGPGESKYLHSISEKLNISQLLDAAKIYAMAIINWCGVVGT